MVWGILISEDKNRHNFQKARQCCHTCFQATKAWKEPPGYTQLSRIQRTGLQDWITVLPYQIGKSICYFCFLTRCWSTLQLLHISLPPTAPFRLAFLQSQPCPIPFGHQYRSHFVERTLNGVGLCFCILFLTIMAGFLCPFSFPSKDLSARKWIHNLRRTLNAKTFMHSHITHSIIKFA